MVITSATRNNKILRVPGDKIDAEEYRSGHNELDSKSSCPRGHVGSNPTSSAKKPMK